MKGENHRGDHRKSGQAFSGKKETIAASASKSHAENGKNSEQNHRPELQTPPSTNYLSGYFAPETTPKNSLDSPDTLNGVLSAMFFTDTSRTGKHTEHPKRRFPSKSSTGQLAKKARIS